MPKTIIHTATGEFRDEQGRFLLEGQSQGWTEVGCPPSPDPAFSIIDLPVGVTPDPRTQRWDGTQVVAKSAQQIADEAQATKLARFDATSQQKDFLTTMACLARLRAGTAAWNVATTQQKLDATLAERDAWRTIRKFIDDKI